MKVEDLVAKTQKSYMEHILPNNPYLGFDIFMQTDGFCLTDINFKNYPISYIIKKFKEKNKRLTIDDLDSCSI